MHSVGGSLYLQFVECLHWWCYFKKVDLIAYIKDGFVIHISPAYAAIKTTVVLFSFIIFASSMTLGVSETPQNLEQLCHGYAVMDKNTPLDVEILKEWDQENLIFRIIR